MKVVGWQFCGGVVLGGESPFECGSSGTKGRMEHVFFFLVSRGQDSIQP